MKLRYSPTSPYVRKVSVVAIEAGLADKIEQIPTNVWDPETDIASSNPLGKVPALETPDGKLLFDSPVICEYLDSLHDKNKLFPPTGEDRWHALRWQALADGILDAAILRLLEGKREKDKQSASWIGRQKISMQRGLDRLEAEVDDFSGLVNIGTLTIAIMLDYIDLRFPDDNWRKGRPALADWYETMASRPSMMTTVPKDPG